MATEATAQEYLVLDSTEVTGDWFLRGAAFREVVKISGLRVALPAPVLAEVLGNHARAVGEVESAARKLLADRHRLGLPEPRAEAPSVAFAIEFGMALVRRGIQVLPWPETPHEEVVGRAIARKPPFDNKGGGYRDTLVWLTAKKLAADGRHVYLASRDRAFRGDRNEASELVASLQDEVAGLDGSVELITELREWVFDRVSVSTRPPVDSRIADWTTMLDLEYLGPWGFEDCHVNPNEVGLPVESEVTAAVDMIAHGFLVPVIVRDLGDGGAFIEYELEATVGVEAEVPLWFAQLRGWRFADAERLGMVSVTPAIDVIVGLGVTFFGQNVDVDDPETADKLDDSSQFAVEFVHFRAKTTTLERIANL